MTPDDWPVRDRFWLAGLLDGEGCFTATRPTHGLRSYMCPVVVVAMTDEDVISRVSTLIGPRKVEFRHPPSHRAKGWQPQYRVQVHGRRAAEVMLNLRPLLSARRSARITELLEEYDNHRTNEITELKGESE